MIVSAASLEASSLFDSFYPPDHMSAPSSIDNITSSSIARQPGDLVMLRTLPSKSRWRPALITKVETAVEPASSLPFPKITVLVSDSFSEATELITIDENGLDFEVKSFDFTTLLPETPFDSFPLLFPDFIRYCRFVSVPAAMTRLHDFILKANQEHIRLYASPSSEQVCC